MRKRKRFPGRRPWLAESGGRGVGAMPGRVSGHVKLAERKRGDQWYVKYRLPSGKQFEKRLGPAWTGRGPAPAGHYTRRTVEAELEAILTDARRGALPDPGAWSGRTFGDATAEWLRYTEHERGRKRSTLRDYRNSVNGALLPEFGAETPLEEITPERIESYRARLLTEGVVSRRTAQKLMVLMHGICRRARSLGWVRENPAETVERVSVPRSGEFNVLTVSQVEAIGAKAEGMFSAAIVVAAYTGLRTGELRALRWRDVHFSSATIQVRRNRPAGGKEDLPK